MLRDDIPMGRKRSPLFSLGGTSVKENYGIGFFLAFKLGSKENCTYMNIYFHFRLGGIATFKCINYIIYIGKEIPKSRTRRTNYEEVCMPMWICL